MAKGAAEDSTVVVACPLPLALAWLCSVVIWSARIGIFKVLDY